MKIQIFGKKYKWAKPVVLTLFSALVWGIVFYGKDISMETLYRALIAVALMVRKEYKMKKAIIIGIGILFAASIFISGCSDINKEGYDCCKAFGYGSEMKITNVNYYWITEGDCIITPPLVGGGREIVNDVYCIGKEVKEVQVITPECPTQPAIIIVKDVNDPIGEYNEGFCNCPIDEIMITGYPTAQWIKASSYMQNAYWCMYLL